MSSPNDFALYAAARARDLDKTLALLAAGTAPDAPSARDVPLIEAAQRGSLEIVRALLEAGADPNRLPPQKKALYPSPFDGMSALDHALVARNEEMALALVQAGADPTRPMRSLYERLLPRDAAEAVKMPRLLAALEARDAPRTPDDALALTPAAVAGRTARVAALLALGTDEQARGSALLMAAQVGQASSMRLLVAEGVSQKAIQTALFFAVQNDHLECVEVLLDAGADLAAETGHHGPPALLVAASNGRAAIARLLIARGANPNQRHEGDTPLKAAARHPETLAAIEAAGADAKAEQKLRTAVRKKLQPYAKPAWRPLLTRGEGADRGSRLGGRPWLASGERWPVDRHGGLMELVLQLDLDALPDPLRSALAESIPGGCVRVFRSAATFETPVLLAPSGAEGALASEAAPPTEPHRAPRAITAWKELAPDLPNGEAGTVGGSLLRIRGSAPLDRTIVASLNHTGHKLGGWPHWVQEPSYGPGARGASLDRLVFQIDDGDSVVGFLFQSSADPSRLVFREQKL